MRVAVNGKRNLVALKVATHLDWVAADIDRWSRDLIPALERTVTERAAYLAELSRLYSSSQPTLAV